MDAFLKERKRVEAQLKAQLESRTVWTDPDRKDELLGALRAARVLRLSSLAPVLCDHLTFTPYLLPPKKMLSLGKEYPAYAALRSIGVPAVPYLLGVLRDSDPRDPVQVRGRRNLATCCLIAIYSPEKYVLFNERPARELARLRIQLELERSSGKAKEWLQEALEHPLLGIAEGIPGTATSSEAIEQLPRQGSEASENSGDTAPNYGGSGGQDTQLPRGIGGREANDEQGASEAR